ncbi:MAG: hypothetical protein GY898_21370 [Proteobacteria bacterium]|nr:hypothetical protein [Pseudomonadota bacterium]
MSRLLIGTRKGLFTLSRKAEGWTVDDVKFLGDPVGLVTIDPRDGAIYA